MYVTSAYQAHLDRSIATLIPVSEAPVQFAGGDTGQLFRHASWWVPDEAAAEAAIRAAIAGRDTPPDAARERTLRELAWERATRRLIALVDDVQPGRGRPRWLTLPWARR